MTMITSGSVPHSFSHAFCDTLDSFFYVYIPTSDKGLAVLNKEAAFVYGLIDGKQDVQELTNHAKKEDSEITVEDIIRILEQFIISGIMYIGENPVKNSFIPKQSKTLGVWFHITNQCNLRCTYCYVHKTPAKMYGKLAHHAMNVIIRDAKKHGYTNITFKFSGGECLLEFPLVLELIHHGREKAKEAGITMKFVVLTNGVLLTEEIAKTLKKENIHVAVSLDGLAKYHDKQRIFANRKGSFAYVEKGIQNLQKYGVVFNVLITITSNNVEHIPDLTEWLLDQNIPFAFNFYRENSRVTEKLEGDDKKLVASLKKAYAHILARPPRRTIMNSLLDRVLLTRPHIWTCGMGRDYLIIRHDGKLASCPMTIDTQIGSIEDVDIIETMLRGNFIRPVDATVESRKPCRNCQWKYVCCGGCPLLSFSQKGTYDTNSPYCHVYKELIPEVLKIEAKRLITYGFSKKTQEDLPSQLL